MEPKLEQLVERSARVWGVSFAIAEEMLSIDRQKTLRVNTLKATNKEFEELKGCFGLLPISWAKNCYQITENYDQVTRHELFLSGYFSLQNSSSFMPVIALKPKANTSILDMCAAPGTKTTHIATLVNNKAQIIANDNSKNRFFKLQKMLKTYGANAQTSLRDARQLKAIIGASSIDTILLDAPCSGEGELNLNKPSSTKYWSLKKIKRLSGLQKQLIVGAYDLLKSGGNMVYSTCTIAPEENELVVNYLLQKRPGAIIKDTNLPGQLTSPGLTSWDTKKLSSSLEKTRRVIPSPANQAFYVAKITKTDNLSENEFSYKQN